LIHTNRIVGRRTASQIASASAASFLLRLTANQHEAEAAAEFAAKVFVEEIIMNGEFVKKGLLVGTDKFEDGWAVYTRHPRIDILRETNRWTFDEAWDFAMRNPIQYRLLLLRPL
jgi:hypothetical protein